MSNNKEIKQEEIIEEETPEEMQEYYKEKDKIEMIPIKTAATDKYYLLNSTMITSIIMIFALVLTTALTTFGKWAGATIAAIMSGVNAFIAIKAFNEMNRLKGQYELKVK